MPRKLNRLRRTDHDEKLASVTIRLAPEEKQKWIEAAHADGRELSNWMRWLLNKAAQAAKG